MVEEREVEVGRDGAVRLGLWPPASSGPMGSCHLTLARLPASSEAWRLGQFNPLLLSSGYFCGEGGWASCWFPQQPSLARLHCVEGPSWEKQWGEEGRSQPSQGLPFLEVEGAVDTLEPWGTELGGAFTVLIPLPGRRRLERGLWAQESSLFTG